MLSNERLYLETRPLCLFFKASIPGAIGMIAANIYFSLEMLLIGRLIGQTAFAAGNLALPLILINFALSDMIAVGSAVRIAISLGEDDKARADRVFTTAVISAILLAGLTSLLLIVFGRPMLAAMGAEGELLDESLIYLRTYAAFCPLTCLVFVFDNYLRICGCIRFSMVMNIVMSFLCLGFEFIFLYVLDLGIAFAALGTSLGMSVTAIICAWPFLRGRLSLGFVRLRPSFSIFHDIMAQGLPSFAVALAMLDSQRRPVGALIAAPRFGIGREDLLVSLMPGGQLKVDGEVFHPEGDKDQVSQVTMGSNDQARIDFSHFSGKVRTFGSSIIHLIAPVVFSSMQGAVNQPSYVWDVAASHAVLLAAGWSIRTTSSSARRSTGRTSTQARPARSG